jgi:cytochrome c-type biogenesis protein CcmF
MVAAAVQELLFRTKLGKVELSVAWARLKGLPGAAWGMMLAHAGVGVFVIGVIGITAWKQEVVTVLKPGDTMEIGGRQITFVGESPVTGPNYSAERGNFRITSSSGATADVWSEKRVFKPSNQPTTEVGIQPYIDGDVYVVIGDRAGEGGRTVRAYFHPLVWFLWLGSAFMFLGGLISMLDRRYRVGAPKQSAAVKIQPAE